MPPPTDLKDALTLLRQFAAPCEGADEHSWRKCKRCTATHGLEMRFDLTMRLLNVAIAALSAPSSLAPPAACNHGLCECGHAPACHGYVREDSDESDDHGCDHCLCAKYQAEPVPSSPLPSETTTKNEDTATRVDGSTITEPGRATAPTDEAGEWLHTEDCWLSDAPFCLQSCREHNQKRRGLPTDEEFFQQLESASSADARLTDSVAGTAIGSAASSSSLTSLSNGPSETTTDD